MTKMLEGSERKGARRAPNAFSVAGEVLPTRMGIKGGKRFVEEGVRVSKW